ncbi:hypothetical protein AN478_03535 [Thiohalorhabdus denitrificans]|uniref:Phospholipid/cholesterol/gamma-HCH transport system permease protein n=1 Tax=Thiohalorhabdus denitrificans TaxID=381306 RepID=A0A0P9CWG6_9GAMM|nr:ABC transporter permease [Thiohalorhabdus denitrificans]KPV41017.1 hypothetical protein AN478_03535 [Thiohalorhabdus denitrificans]SCY41573.1 phospholipid/cholesterol/gamma-HCH transport system permease protein [Thiohalorhabdus denitrificans]
MAAEPRIDLERVGGEVFLSLSGDWVIDHAISLDQRIQAIPGRVKGEGRVIVRGSAIGALDTTGAWLLQRLLEALAEQGLDTTSEGFREPHSRFLARISQGFEPPVSPPRRHWAGPVTRLERLGRHSVGGIRHVGELTAFLAQVLLDFVRCLLLPHRFRLGVMVANMFRAGVTAIPIVALMAFLISIVLSYQGMVQLERFGAEIYTINLAVVSLLREMGVLLTAVVVAGRSGSAFAAELGVMRLNGEIDAMHVLGMPPTEILVLPRILALLIMVPLLTLLADLAGLVGSAFSARILVGLSLPQFLHHVQTAVTPASFWVGMIKAPIFAFLIALTATFWGMKEADSPEKVGQQVTVSVVQSIFLVIVADALVSVALSRLGA